MTLNCYLAASLILFAVSSCGGADRASLAQPVEIPGVHNAFRVTANIYSGSQPEGTAAFAELAKLGVKTIISVDGSKPEVETARKYGLRYVHLPIGYDGVPASRIAELSKAAQFRKGAIYVHCHHGLHRGPTAVAVICETTAGWNASQAVSWMKQAGTSPEYPGLYRSATEFRKPDPVALAQITELPEISATSSLVKTMVAIDDQMDRLKTAQKSGWTDIPNLAHGATILWEHFREMQRTADFANRPEDYRAKLAAAEKGSADFRASLVDSNAQPATRNRMFESLTQSCLACHKQYRNEHSMARIAASP